MRKFHTAEVEATFTPNGWPLPHSLRWEEETLPVIELGRHWRAEERVHVLVLVSDGRVFELVTDGSQWWAALVSVPPVSRFI
ncbi:MAG: hypothetical protein ACUVSU_08655 [Aggregatilineaceae bacterium]